MTTDNKTLADVQPGGRVRLEREPRDHRWDDVGERCLDCGDKDWMGGACSGPRTAAAAGLWRPITNAPNDGQQHIRGLWVTSRIDGKPDTREWRQYIGLLNDEGAFVDPECGETFGWEADEYDAWMPSAEAPGAALAAQPSPGGQDGPAYEGHTWISDYVLAGLRERAALPLQLRNGEVWHWQGDGHDFPESLVCPVIMSAETLRALLAARQPVGEDALATIATQAGAYVYGLPGERYYDFTAAQLEVFLAAVTGRPLAEQRE